MTINPIRATGIGVTLLLKNLIGFLLCLVTVQATALEDRWAPTLAETAQSVVSLQLSQLRNFDDSEQGGSTATGFVVDAERGIVLTNRHVVGSGPIRITATFQNQERVDAVPLYRDPIHDFAFVRYDPAELKYATPRSLPLRPEKVRTGLNIRVLGSDGGEQLSILTGTIARVDREPPSYGRYGYNDFNTFYLQAASSTSGGSSGSPVIDLDGDVVALNAAANTRTASSFFLPLYRIQRALENLQTGVANTRGGFQTLFSHQPFRQLRRLGLDENTENQVRERDASNTGMLIVRQVFPGGVSDGQFQAGDILIRIDDQLIANYIELEATLDEHIGQELSVDIMRQGKPLKVQVAVADLHAIAPDRFLELGDAILQDMSIQHTRAMNLPAKGVVVMKPGYFFSIAKVPQSSVITEIDGESVESLDDFLNVLMQVGAETPVLIRFIVPGREFTSSVAQLEVSNRWFGYRTCQRVDNARFWDCQNISLPVDQTEKPTAQVKVPGYKDKVLNRVAPALVRVEYSIPYITDNVYATQFSGVGLVVDRNLGLIAVDRNTVPVSMGDAEVIFFGSHVTSAETVFLHPMHNIALLKYDPAELADAEFEHLELAAEAEGSLSDLFMVGYRADGTFRKHPVDGISPLTIGFNAPSLPRFQQSAADVLGVPDLPPSLGGPLVDGDGVVHAVWISYAYQDGKEIAQNEWAMPAEVIRETVDLYRSGQEFSSLDVDLIYQPISVARELGLPDEWLKRYFSLDADQRRVLYVEQIVPGTDAAEQLQVGDILLAIDGELVANLFSIEQMVQKDAVGLSLLRAGEVVDVTLKPSRLSGLGTRRVVNWAGATFQEPHWEIARFKGLRPAGVYIADTEEGSPALWDRLYRNRFVTAVDGIPVADLDEFLSEIRKKDQDEITRLSLLSMSGREGIVSVQPEYNFWPTFEIIRTDGRWVRRDITH